MRSLLHLSLLSLFLADVFLHAVVQDALHPEAVHPGDRWCDPHSVLILTCVISFLLLNLKPKLTFGMQRKYRSCHELAIEGPLHDLAKELFPKHLLSKLHQLKTMFFR